MKNALAAVAALTVLSWSGVHADLIGLYTFDNAADPMEDSSGQGNDITTALGPGGPTWGANFGYQASGAYQFGGDGDRLVVPIDINPSPLPQMTWGAWVRTDSLASGLRKVMGHDNGGWDRTLGLDNRDDNVLRYTSFNGAAAPSTRVTLSGPANTTDWAFLAASYDQLAGTMTVYLDLDASTDTDPLEVGNGSATFGSGFSTFSIGNLRPDNNNEAWNGAIDQVFLYDEILDLTKMSDIRRRGLNELLGIPEGDPEIAPSLSTLFGDLTGLGAGPGMVAQTVKITNNGATQDLNLTDLTVTGTDAGFYALTPPATMTLGPGGELDLEVVFTPPVEGGSFTATLEISSNDEVNPVVSIPLNATVTTDPNMEVFAADPLFGRVFINEIPAAVTREFVVRNTGVANTLTLDTPVVTGANASNYSVMAPSTSIGPGEETVIEVSLDPMGMSGGFSANIELTSDDPDSGGYAAALSANLVVVDPASLLAFYPFDNEADPFEDLSGNGNHISMAAGPGSEMWGADFGFDGSGGYQFIGDGSRLIAPIDVNPGVLPQMTWGAWVRTDNLSPGLRKFMGHDNGAWDRTLGLDNRDDGALRYTSFNGAAAPTTQLTLSGPVNTTDWAFLAASYDQTGAGMTVYLDLDASTSGDTLEIGSGNANFNTGFDTFSIGSLRPDNNAEGWNGAIDNVFVYEGILTTDQVFALRAGGRDAIVGPIAGPRLDVSQSGDNLVFTWESLGGKIYTLRSETDPSAGNPISWPVWDGNADIPATPPENMLTIPRPADEFRLFVIEERNAPPVEVFFDDFESGMGTWEAGVDADTGTAWELGEPSAVGPLTAQSPANCFGTNIGASYTASCEVWLKSPVIDLTSAGAATLTFYQFVDIDVPDNGRVAILDADNADAELAVVEPAIPILTSGWEEASYNVPAAALGKNVKIEFRFTSSDSGLLFSGWYLDDVQVTVP